MCSEAGHPGAEGELRAVEERNAAERWRLQGWGGCGAASGGCGVGAAEEQLAVAGQPRRLQGWAAVAQPEAAWLGRLRR